MISEGKLTEFKERMKENGQSFKWFHEAKIDKYGVGYAQFIQQINGYYAVKKDVANEIVKYLSNGN